MTPFHVNDRQAKHYRVGSVFLAGDASHIHSPVGGQGMNTGMQDVANLGWKLAAFSRGGSATLLDSYEEERGEVGRRLLRFTEGVLKTGTSLSRVVETVRDAVVPLVTHLGPVQQQAMGFVSETAIHYRGSSVVSDQGGDGALRAGERCPDLTCGQESGPATLLSGWTDAVHLALLVNGTAEEMEQVRARLRNVRVVGAQPEAMGNEARRLLGSEKKLLIVRPDGYVGFRGAFRQGDHWMAYARQDGLL